MNVGKRFKKQVLSLILSFMLILSYLPIQVSAKTSNAGVELSEDIVILYTNDIHTHIDGNLSYDIIAAIKQELKTKYKYVILADAGDHIQGTAYGAMDEGASIIELMNAAEYDIATLGNHEFDYDMEGCLNAIDNANFDYVSCNFYNETDGVRGTNVLDSFKMFECGDEVIAFVGITTPESFTKSAPAYFQDDEGNFIYGISGGEDGAELRSDVQNTIDEAKREGATKVIALGHLGVDSSSKPWTSEETIAGIEGLDAFIDGHSHTVMESKNIKDKNGDDVILTQTGEYFNRIGMMVIDSNTGDITTDFIEYDAENEKLVSDLYEGVEVISDSSVKAIQDAWIEEIDGMLGQKIGEVEVTLDNYDEEGNRLVRVQETNSGDFVTDALYYLFDEMDLDVDVSIMNGGGIRNDAITGDITYRTCKEIYPFGNVACLQKVTGQQILDMLEWGSRDVGESENGSFLQVSGLTYKVDTSIPNTTKANDMSIWTGGPDEYRVFDVKIYNKENDTWEDLDVNAEYNLAGYNYTLRNLGDGFAMLDGAVNIVDYVMDDYMILANYVEAFENGVVGATNSPLLSKYSNFGIDYGNVNGSGRIVFEEKSSGTDDDSDKSDDTENSGKTEDEAGNTTNDTDGTEGNNSAGNTVLPDSKDNTNKDNGKSEAKDVPKTGDANEFRIWLVVMIFAAVIFSVRTKKSSL